MSNKNDFPSWLDAPDPGGDENDQQPENEGGELPPWLNPQANAPQADADDDGGDLPPWLQGEDPPVVYNFGGAELSEEYLSGGDQLIDRHESDITYDEWVAQQAEDARPKSIDEEIPDLISDIPDTGALTGESTGGTGQLPEWFLGLEELDESEIPDWFKDAQEIEAPPSGAPGDLAPWMMDLVQTEPPPEPAQSAMLDDDVETFFSSMGSGFRLEEDEPVVDWFAATTGNEPTTTEEDDFFAQFGVKPPAPPAPPPPSAEPVLADDDWIEQSAPPTSTVRPSSDLPDEEFYKQFIEPPPSDDIELPDVDAFGGSDIGTGSLPPIDLDDDDPHPAMDLPDDLFASLAKNREVADVEDPDVSWFLNVPQTGSLLAPDDEIAAPTQIRRPPVEDSSSLSWLNELEDIVSSATSEPAAEPPTNDFVTDASDDPWAALRQSDADEPAASLDEFDWGQVAETPAEPEAPSLDWLNAIGDTPAVLDADEPVPDDLPAFTVPTNPPPARPALSGLLQRAAEPEPEPLDEAWNTIPDSPAADLQWEAVPDPDDSTLDPASYSDALRGFTLEDVDFDAPPTDWELPAALGTESGVEEIAMDDFLSGLDLEATPSAETPAGGELSFTDMLRDLNQEAPRFEEEPEFSFGAEDDDAHIPDDELYSGWLTDDLLADEEDAPPAQPAAATSAEDDFFALIEKGIDHNLIRDSGYLSDDQPEFELPNFDPVPEPTAFEAEPSFELPSTDDLRMQFGDLPDTPSAEAEFELPSAEDYAQPWAAATSTDEPSFELPTTDDLRMQFGDLSDTPDENAAFELPTAEDDQLWGAATPGEEPAFELPNTDELRQRFGDLPPATEPTFEQPADGEFSRQFGQPSDTPAEEPAFELPSAEDFDFLTLDAATTTDDDDIELPGTGDLNFDFFATSEPVAEPAADDFDFESVFAELAPEPEPSAPAEPENDFDFQAVFGDVGEPGTQAEYSVVGDMLSFDIDDEAAETPEEPAAALEEDADESEELAYELPSFEAPEFQVDQEMEALEDEPIAFPDFGWDHLDEETDAPAYQVEPPAELMEDVSDIFAEQPPNADGWVRPEEEELIREEVLPNTSELFSMFDELEDAPNQPATEDELFAADVDWLGDDAYVERMRDLSTKKTDSLPDFDSLFGAPETPADDDLSMFEPEAAPDYNAAELFSSFDAVSAMDDEPTTPLPKTGPLPVFDAVSAFESDGDTGALAFEIDDIDAYLQSLDGPEIKRQTGDFFGAQQDVDLDELFNEELIEDDPNALPNPDLEGLAPATGLDWLGANVVGSVSAGAIARQMGDSKPPEELPDRLKRLRQRADQIPDEEDANWITDSLAYVLPGVISTLTPAPLRTDELNPVGANTVALTPEQTEHVGLLRSMLALDIKPQKLNAIELTYDSPFAPDIADHPDTIVHETSDAAPVVPVPVAQPKARPRPSLERWFVALIVLAAVIGPYFIGQLRIGDLPPAVFGAGSRGELAFARVDALNPGDLLLIGVEYGATAAAELDLMTDSLIRHALLRGARPVVISSNPVTQLRVTNLIGSINTDADFLNRVRARDGLQANLDYFVVQYLPGSVLGLRAFSGDSAAYVLTDITGQSTGLYINSLDAFALVALVTERPEDVRAYAEQIAPLVGQPLIAAVSYSAAPLTEPYADSPVTSGSPIAGLLVGYGDAYTYSGLLASVIPVERSRIPDLPTPQPTPVQPEPTPVAPVAAEVTPEPTVEATPEDTAAGETPAVDEVFATVSSSGNVRVRGGPGTDFDIVDNLANGTRVQVLGYNDAGDWVNVRLDDGVEGWISASLLDIATPKRAPKPPVISKRTVSKPVQQDDPTPEVTAPEASPTRTPRPTRTARPTLQPTAEPTAEVTVEVTVEATAEATAEAAFVYTPPPTLAARDARWYSQTLGTLAIATLIAVGAVFNVIRALFQRRRSR